MLPVQFVSLHLNAHQPVFVKKYNFFLLREKDAISNVMKHHDPSSLQKKRKPRVALSIIDNKSGAILKPRSGGR